MIATKEFRDAIEQLAEYEINPISRWRVRRALRNERVLERWRQRVSEQFVSSLSVGAPIGTPVTFDFQQLLDWMTEHWDEILRILLTLLPMFL